MPFLVQVLAILLAIVLIFSVAVYIINSIQLEPRGRSLAVAIVGCIALVVLVWVVVVLVQGSGFAAHGWGRG